MHPWRFCPLGNKDLRDGSLGIRFGDELSDVEMRAMERMWRYTLFAGLLIAVLAVGGCTLPFRPLLSHVSVSPQTISPNADRQADVTLVTYALGRNAYISIYFIDQEGHRYYFRNRQRRARGEYSVFWGGVIEGTAVQETPYGRQTVVSRVLPAGTYTWVIEAEDDRGNKDVRKGTITITEPDNTIPELRNFAVSPRVFTPNQDGIDDRVAITYYLSEDVDELVVSLLPLWDNPLQPKTVPWILAETERNIKPTQKGLHYIDYEGGVDNEVEPPPDGDYQIVARARDAAGNTTLVTTTLTIVEGGVPRADILNAEVTMMDAGDGDRFLAIGDTLVFTATVENYGRVPIRTSGPPPGTHYNLDENFNTLAVRSGNRAWHEQAGVWRFAIDFQTNGGQNYPFRWAIGRREDLECRLIDGEEQCYLMPGKRGLVYGTITINYAPPRDNIVFWSGLIHEDVGILPFNNRVDPHTFHIDIP